ncbi:MAG: polysaccharide deacetylase family protein [bacterium]|nr:polysaccharide deacetylase family protein [bacterium]
MIKNKSNGKVFINVLIIFIILLILGCSLYLIYQNKIYNKKQEEDKKREQAREISSYYHKYVKTNKDSDLYILSDNNYQKIGEIKENEELELSPGAISSDTLYFKIKSLENTYYISYEDIDKIDSLSVVNDRYRKYIVYNTNIITKNNTRFYNEKGDLIYTLYKSYELPIIIKDNDRYGVEFNNRLLYIKNDDVLSTVDKENSSISNTHGIAVLNYHFFYDDNDTKCNQVICLSKSKFSKHLKYIKDNNIFTPTLEELEKYIDGKIQLPKSVVITIDDGWMSDIGVTLLEEYKLNGTVFLITSWFDKIDFLNNYKYVEYHSHGNNLHSTGVCRGGQGGGIKCLEKDKLLADLKTSREKLAGSKYFCYPFYEYNDYSISVLKEAGFTMSFGGSMEGGISRVRPGIDKFRIPRFVIYRNTSVENIKAYID